MTGTAAVARRSARRTVRAGLAAVALLVLLPAAALAHPLGNFTINHYAGIRVAPDQIGLDVVIDSAEIQTVIARQRIDANGDGVVSDAETEAERQAACGRLAAELTLTVGGVRAGLATQAAGLSFPPGAGGLQTMRLVCEYISRLSGPIAAGTAIGFRDDSNAGHLGWREVVILGDGVTVSGSGLATTSVSNRLTSYPKDLLTVPLNESDVTFTVAPGGARLAPACIAEATSLTAPPDASSIGFGCTAAAPAAAPAQAAVPGGVGSDIAALLKTQDLTPPIVLLSLLTAIALGAGHALTPGHGKTVMAAYLVGTRGTPRHALALGLTVTISHTLGVLTLAAVILALNVVTPESFNHVTGIVSGLIVIGIGAWLLWRQGVPVLRARSAAARAARVHANAHAADEPHDHPHDHEHPHDHVHPHDHEHEASSDPGTTHLAPGYHSHGGEAHTHLPSEDTPLTWRSLFALGLFGGLVPSINALLILLATLATGRAAYGLVLVVAFGIGMALVLGGIGLGLVYAARWMERAPQSSPFGRILELAPAVTAAIIFAVGIYLTRQAIVGAPVL